MRPERLSSERGIELLRQEVRSAREVLSPNVSAGHGIEPGPFPGWKTVPSW
jgi:hypothetical protein